SLCNARADLEIYTLSLHDALPIWHATADDLFTLTASGVIGQTSLVLPNPFNIMGVTYPLDDMYVLIPAEQVEISTATTQFNQIIDRKSTRLNSSHVKISYAVFCLK